MAYVLSGTTEALSQKIDKEPVLILDIDGSQYLYGTGPILETAKWDDDRIKWDNQNDITWDGEIEKEISKPYISWDKTTSGLSQQLLVDKGGSGSISTMDIAIVDFRNEVATDLSFDQMEDALGRRADVYLGLKGGRHPQDSVPIFKGFIDDLKYEAGLVIVSVSHPENLKRQPTFEQHQSQLTSAINAIVTTVPVTITSPFVESGDSITSYIKINDEVMEVVTVNPTSFEVVRGALGTLIDSHESDDDVESFYRLQGKPIELALKLMLSKPGNEFTTNEILRIKAINQIDNVTNIPGAILINDLDVEDRSGLNIGDIIKIEGSASNDGEYPISSFNTINTGQSYIVLEGSFTNELNLDLALQFRSKYNVLNEGLGLAVDQVDAASFEQEANTFSANFIDYDYYIKKTIDNTKEFIDKSLFLPQRLYTIPRKAKISCKYESAPFTIQTLPTLNTSNIVDITKVQMRRSTHKYLYNEVVFRYNEGVLEDKLFDKVITINTDSLERIKAGRKRYAVDVGGIRRSSESIQVLGRAASKILGRYKFAARYITNVKVLFETGINLEIGDIVFMGGEDTQLFDLKTGLRNMPIAQYEIVNKRLDIRKGDIKLSLLETGFSFENSIFAVFSPSSVLDATSTATKIGLDELFVGCSSPALERVKWEQWVGSKVRVRSEDYTYDEIATIDRLDATTENRLILDPPLPSPPPAGAILELAKVDEYGDTDLEQTLKLKYSFTMPSMKLTAVTDSQEFDVENTEGLEVGMLINIHSDDYSSDSITVRIDSIVLNTITLVSALNFTPSIGDNLQVYAYADSRGYRFL